LWSLWTAVPSKRLDEHPCSMMRAYGSSRSVRIHKATHAFSGSLVRAINATIAKGWRARPQAEHAGAAGA
jgi:hypothetical protein